MQEKSTSDEAGPHVAEYAGSESDSWDCPTCSVRVHSRFCPSCGERSLDPGHLTLRGLLAQFFAFLVSVDSRILNSLRCLITRPGGLTLAFEAGRRQGYIGPFKLFVLANLLFFAMQSTTELHVFATPLESQLNGAEGSDYGRALLHRYLDEHGLSVLDYAPIYNQAVSIHARSMIGLMVLPFSLFLPLFFFRRSRPFAVHVVFSLHFYAFLLLLYCVPAALLGIRRLLGGDSTLSPTADNVLSVMLTLSLAAYLFAAIHRVFGSRGFSRIIQTLLLTILQFTCFLAYRFALVPITVFLTR